MFIWYRDLILLPTTDGLYELEEIACWVRALPLLVPELGMGDNSLRIKEQKSGPKEGSLLY